MGSGRAAQRVVFPQSTPQTIIMAVLNTFTSSWDTVPLSTILLILGGIVLVYFITFPAQVDAREPPLVRPAIPFIGHVYGLLRHSYDYHRALLSVPLPIKVPGCRANDQQPQAWPPDLHPPHVPLGEALRHQLARPSCLSHPRAHHELRAARHRVHREHDGR